MLLGALDGIPVYISESQFVCWQHSQLLLMWCRGSGFSLEAPEGIRFLTRSRVFSAAEMGLLTVDR